jgi:GNAT superfamily N-acetyltransferase
MTPYSIRELGSATWPDFVRIMEKHNGVWNGCWCLQFHLGPGERVPSVAQRRRRKESLVRSSQSHSALVYDASSLVGWCQFGPPTELPGRMTAYGRLGVSQPDWRITCFFVDRDRRKEGIARAALEGALRLIAAEGGGTVDGYPIDTRGKHTSGSFLWSGTESMFAQFGFRPLAPLGTSKLVMRKLVRSKKGGPSPPSRFSWSGAVDVLKAVRSSAARAPGQPEV